MGCRDCGLSDAEPVHWVSLKGYWMDETPVTNQDLAAFVARSHHKTTAEQIPRAEDYPDVPPEALVSGSAVFSPPAEPSSLSNPYAWWRYIPGASWSSPDGKTPLSPSLALHPVVHVSFHDAESYCQAMGKTLSTEAEYEFAARGGLHAKKYAWGDKLKKTGNGPLIFGKDLFLQTTRPMTDSSKPLLLNRSHPMVLVSMMLVATSGNGAAISMDQTITPNSLPRPR